MQILVPHLMLNNQGIKPTLTPFTVLHGGLNTAESALNPIRYYCLQTDCMLICQNFFSFPLQDGFLHPIQDVTLPHSKRS